METIQKRLGFVPQPNNTGGLCISGRCDCFPSRSQCGTRSIRLVPTLPSTSFPRSAWECQRRTLPRPVTSSCGFGIARTSAHAMPDTLVPGLIGKGCRAAYSKSQLVFDAERHTCAFPRRAWERDGSRLPTAIEGARKRTGARSPTGVGSYQRC